MKTRNEIYQGEGAQLLRFITTYHSLQYEQILRLFSKNRESIKLNNPVPVSLLSGDRKPQIRFLGNHHSGSGNLYHKSFRM